MIKRFIKQPVKRAYRAPWYDTVRWRKARVSFLQDNPLCTMCDKDGQTTAATIVDHITNVSSVPKEKRYDLFWDSNNWQPLCKRHHDSKSGTERHR